VGTYQLAVLDVASGDVRPLTALGEAKAINPQWSAGGSSLYFLSDRTGAPNVFRLDVAGNRMFQVTDLATGVSGITATSPALSVAESAGHVAFSVFRDDKYEIYALDRPELADLGAVILDPAGLPDVDVRGRPENAVAQLTLQTCHQRQRDDQRHDADRDANGGDERDKGDERLLPARQEVAKGDEELETHARSPVVSCQLSVVRSTRQLATGHWPLTTDN